MVSTNQFRLKLSILNIVSWQRIHRSRKFLLGLYVRGCRNLITSKICAIIHPAIKLQIISHVETRKI
jgi:hypothetical protein